MNGINIMKYFLSIAIACLFTGSAWAEEFQLQITPDNVIVHNDGDWQLAAQSNIFQLMVNKHNVGTNKNAVEIYSVTEFHDPAGQKYEQFSRSIYKIYTHGILECQKSLFNILSHWFVDKDNKVVYNEIKPAGSYVIDMRAGNTPRNDLYRLVCNK